METAARYSAIFQEHDGTPESFWTSLTFCVLD